MRIRKIEATNFKGFEDRTFQFDSHFNAFVGKNASGKSTALQAIQIALGGYLQCLPLPATPQYRRQFKPGEVFVKWVDELKDYVTRQEPTSIKAIASWSHAKSLFANEDTEFAWTRTYLNNNTTSHSKAEMGSLMEVVQSIVQAHQEHSSPMPIVASFGIGRTVAQIKKGKKKQSTRTRIQKAFLSALLETVDFNGVTEWAHRYEKELIAKREFEGTLQAVYEAICTAIPYLTDLEFDLHYQEFEADVTIDGVELGKTLHSNMSDGLRAMLNMVAEMAFRCAMINGYLGKEAIRNTPGVVLIDELDMHLHPNWQRRVVQDLKNAFPQIQFIVTTHSPYIIQSLRKNELIALDEDMQLPANPYGMGIEDLSESPMGVEDVPRSALFIEKEKLAAEYFSLIKEGHTSTSTPEVEALRQRLNALEERFCDNPVYTSLMKAERIGNGL